ncbi:hypothetical protein [Aquipuribacter sp. MA13-6]|uniref:hypothetical protein n=1 Tax=unclassified Aquipuribacter TaxID=2635084 RepID=UPI003EED73D3
MSSPVAGSPSAPTTGTAAAPTTSAAAVMTLIEGQLAEERSTKASLEARAIGVVTSSGALTTLLFALSALVTRPTDYELPGPARYVLLATLLAFLLAAVLAILAARPGTYHEVTVESLEEAATAGSMASPVDEGSPKIATVLVDIIRKARVRNGKKATFLKAAVTCQVAAAVLLSIGVGVVLLHG